MGQTTPKPTDGPSTPAAGRGPGRDPVPEPRAPSPRRRSRGWVPDQHGAWAMLVLPFVAGATLGGWRWAHLPLGLLWLLGYFTFYASGRWLKTRRRTRERTPMLVYAALCVPAGLVTLATSPALLCWAPAFAPLLVVSLWLTARGAERSLANDAVAVLAAVLMAPVAYDAAGGQDWTALWVITGILGAYFLGTVLYVKTMIRERGRTGYVVASVGYHALGVAAVAVLVATGWQEFGTVVVWGLLAIRAAAMPAINARRARPLRPVVVGVGEIATSAAVIVTALSGLPAA